MNARPVAGLLLLLCFCGPSQGLPAHGAEALSLHVATNGNNSWSGKLSAPNALGTDGPFASVERARDEIRKLKQAGPLPAGGATVYLRGGTYRFAKPITFAPEDSGSPECPIRYAAYRDEKPVLSGGRPITGFKPVGQGAWSTALPEVKAGTWFFRSLFADGQRQIRARHPNVDPSDPCRKGFLYVDRSLGGFGMAVGNIHNPGDWMEYQVKVPADGEYRFLIYYGALNQPFGNPDMSGRTVLVVDNGAPIPLTDLADTGGWSATRWADGARVRLTRGEHLLRWQNVKGGGLNLEAYALTDDPGWKPKMTDLPKVAFGKHLVVIQAEDFVRFNGRQLSVAGGAGSTTAFHFKPGAFKPSWAAAPDAEIHIFQSGSCRAFKEIVSIAKVDLATATVTVSGPECVAPLSIGDRYFVENVLEELDSPGEWYLDPRTGVLHYQPQPGFSQKSEVIAPVAGRLVQFTGGAARQAVVSHITLAGLTFQDTDYSPADGCAGYGMGNDGVVYLTNATHCAVADCTFRNIGKYAVCLAGGGNNSVTGNDISDSAEGGVLLLKSARNTVSDNHIHHCGAVYKHIGGVILEGPGTDENVVSHNTIHDLSRYGISLKNPGRRNVIEFNRVERTNTETYDTGGIEVTQGDKEFRSGSVIRYNLVGDTIGYSYDGRKPVFMSWGIYLDSYAGGYDVNHNICYRSHNGGIMLQGGKDNRVTNNIFVDGETSQGQIANFANNSTGQVMERNIFHYTDTNSTLFALGKLTPAVIQLDYNLYFCPGLKEPRVGWGGRTSFRDWQQQDFDVHSVVADPRFVDAKRDNYALHPDSPAFKLGFEAIDTSKIGLLRDRCRCQIPPARL